MNAIITYTSFGVKNDNFKGCCDLDSSLSGGTFRVTYYGENSMNNITGYTMQKAVHGESIDKNRVVDFLQIKNLTKIKQMKTFENNWNGNGGMPFSNTAIDLFKMIILQLKRQPQIAPTGRNSLFMQYKSEDGSLLAFEVTEKYTEKIYVPKGDYEVAKSEVFTDNVVREIQSCVELFYDNR